MKRVLPYAIGGEADEVELGDELVLQRQPVLKRATTQVVTRQAIQAAPPGTFDTSKMSFNPTRDWFEEIAVNDEYVLGEMGVKGSEVTLQFYHHKDLHPHDACVLVWERAVEELGALDERD